MKTSWTKSELRELFHEWWSSKMTYSTISHSSEEAEAQDTVVGAQNLEVGEEGSYALLRMEPFGFFCVPMPNQPGLILTRYGDNGFVLPLGNARYKPNDTKRGEVGLYCSQRGTTIRLKPDGSITIDADSGKDIVLNQGTQAVARKDDSVDGGSIMLLAPMGVLTSAQYFPVGTPLPAPLPTGAIVIKLSGGKITSGAGHVNA